jgi:lysophospholipase L1-like esterase
MGHYFATFGLAGQTLNSKGKELDEPAFRLDVQTDAALAFLRRHHGQDRKPFFLYLAYFGPHVPLEAPTNYLARFPGPMAERRRYALAMLSAIDDGVGRITAALKHYGVSDNTLIFYTSDNGAPLGAAQPGGPMTDVLPVDEPGAAWDGSMNVPWLGEKGMLAEGGMHVPFIMNWPGRLPAGKVYEQPVSTLDIASTAVALAGLPHDDKLDGVNLMPFLTGKNAEPPHDALYWRFWNQAAVRAGQWKYIQAGTTAQYLFDVTSDEQEKKNLINQHPEIAKSLAEKLSDWTRQLAPPGDPDRPLKIPEQRLYQYYFGLPDEPPAPANMKPEPGSTAEKKAQAWTFTPDPKLPNVLILGDSISIGYTLDVRKLLAGKANVYRAMTAKGKRVDNCGDTQRGLKFIDKWLGDTKWDVIYFNWGLHDLKRVSAEKGMQSDDPSVPPLDSIEVYAENLTKLVARLKQTGASLIFATTTPYPAGVKPCRIPEDAERYNQAALAVMKKNGVRVNDLYSAVLPRLAELQLATNVHFKPEGSAFLAQKVAASIISALERR